MRRVYSAFVLDRQGAIDQWLQWEKEADQRPRWEKEVWNSHANDDLTHEQRLRYIGERNNSPLRVSEGAPWADHFHVWRGQSRKRYICSVFQVSVHEELGGLPEFSGGICLSVRLDPSGDRMPVNMFEFAWEAGEFLGHEDMIEAALAGGAQEWHIHLLAVSTRDKRAVFEDLAFPSYRFDTARVH
jgi:hypothetical protein